MYKNIYIEREGGFSRGTVHIWDDQMGYYTLPLSQFTYAYKPSSTGKLLSMNGTRVTKTKSFDPDTQVFESDVTPETRVLTDLYLHEDNVSTGCVVFPMDIEVSTEDSLPDAENPVNEITAISFYDVSTKMYTVLVLNKGGHREDIKRDDAHIRFFESESELLHQFIAAYEEIGPTIITGWNSDQFDIPYLYARLKYLFGENVANRLSPIGQVRYSNFKNKWIIAGVSCLDYLDLYKKFTYTEQPNYRLGTIGRLEVGLDKIEYDGTLDSLLRDDPDKFIEYSLRDTVIVVKLEEKLKLIELVRGICHLGHVPYEDYGFSSRFLEGTILTYLHRKGIVANNKPAGYREMMEERDESDEEGFEGAYVKEPVPGMYHWIYSLDLQSLYPSIIMSLNISPETKVGVVVNYDIERHLNGQMQEYSVRQDTGKVYTLNREQFLEYVEMENLMISSNGVLYREIKEIVVGKIVGQSD